MTGINLAKLLDVFQSGNDEFTSTHLPFHATPDTSVAYGGCTTGLAIRSAFKTITKPNFHVYSVMGAFHGPTLTDRPAICRVTRTRDTRTFASRHIEVYQKQDNGSERVCADIFVEFHVLEDAMMRYSAAPTRDYGKDPEDHSTSMDGAEILAESLAKGQDTQLVAGYVSMLNFQLRICETRLCRDGLPRNPVVSGTSQGHLSITEKVSAEWIRSWHPLMDEPENIAALVSIMDSGLTPLPLILEERDLFGPSACSTLDFALRIMLPGIQMHKWHLRERKTVAAAVGRTYSESRVWDEDGKLVVIASQSNILRPRKEKKAKI